MTLKIGDRVRVYYNLQKKCLSVQQKVDVRVIKDGCFNMVTRWRVVGHVEAIDLNDVVFKVSTKGVERIRRTKRKSVVAYVEGNVAPPMGKLTVGLKPIWQKVKFNPYVADYFYDETGRKYERAHLVVIIEKLIYVKVGG